MSTRRLLKTGAICATVLMCTSVATTATTVAAPKETVTMWSWFTQSDMQQAINTFEAQHPNITVKYSYYNYSPQLLTALKTGAATGTLPDIIGLQPGSFNPAIPKRPRPAEQLGCFHLGRKLD